MKRFCPVVMVSVAMLGWGHGDSGRPPRRDGDPLREVARVRGHLAGAEMLILGHDLSTLTASQRAARARLIADLRSYRRRGVFPHNHRLPGRRTPVFVDEHGTRCAMAYLIERSGERALVARIARSRNLARIRDLAGDPDLAAWLDRNGLTLAEAARIQPEYSANDAVASDDSARLNAQLAAVGAVAGATGIGLNLSSAASPNARNTRGMLGVAFGLIGAGLGVPVLTEDGGVRVVGVLDIGLGIASFALGLRQLSGPGKADPPPEAHAAAAAIWRDRAGVTRLGLVTRF